MKEKYVGKVKVPFCVRVDSFDSTDREELMEIYRELGFYTPLIAQLFKYDGVRWCGTLVECWDRVESFGENTTVYTLEELQAIIDSLNNIDEEIPELDLKEDTDGWIPWSGSDVQPVKDGICVDVKFRDNTIHRGTCFIWWWSEQENDIVAYRIVGEYLTPHPVSCSDDTDTLDEDEYVGIASGETGCTDSVGSSVKVVANISFDVVIKGQSFTLTSDELKELYTQLCVAEGNLQEWSIGE